MNKILLSFVLLLISSINISASTPLPIVPRPQSIAIEQGFLQYKKDHITYHISPVAPSLSQYLDSCGWTLSPSQSGALIKIKISPASSMASEAYKIKIGKKDISISAKTETGAFYATQTLRQIINADTTASLPRSTIIDSPRFEYRGLHFDVSRHFRSIDFLKKQIDAMAELKLNKMHLHLTDGAGWRMPIESYPRLNSYAAWRPQRSWMDWRDAGATYCENSDPRANGGFYTKDQLRDLVDYAAKRHITIIPEIEMPGHSEEVLAAYPQLSCDGTGKGSDLCPGKEETFEFLQKVLDEVIEIFPSTDIHIGGDEAGKGAWHHCADCQHRMSEEGLENVDQLQSYLIKRIERYLNSRGRNIIGWDEILQGGVAPNAKVMSWRGTEGGIEALKSGHEVIMTPGAYCYIDYSQDAPFREPVSIGGYTPLSKVYSYEPLDSCLSTDEVSNLLGVQANLWSEYVTEDSHAEHMYYPRAYAIAEIGWSPAGKDYDDFHNRSLIFNDYLKNKGYNVFNLANEYGDRKESLQPISHSATGKTIKYITPYHSKYPGTGDNTLTDGQRGGWNNNDGRWQGFLSDVDVIVDLGEVLPIHYVDASFIHSEGAWIHLPEDVTISVSTDGENFTEVGKTYCDVDPQYAKILVKDYGTPTNTQGRFVRLHATKNPREGSWLFIDEIIIN